MNASRAPCPLHCPTQAELDALMHAGIDIMAVATPVAMQVALGGMAPDGVFEPGSAGRWFAFPELEADDIVFWRWTTGQICSWSRRVFALGETLINLPETYSFDCALNIYDNPLEWLRARREGIVVLDWSQAFDRLRDAPRIAIPEALLPTYRRFMKPGRMPELFVTPERRRTAA